MFLGHWDLHIPVRGMRLTFGKHQATMSIRLDGTACDGMGRGGDVTNPVRVTRITAMATRVRSYLDSNRFGRRAHPSNRASVLFQAQLTRSMDKVRMPSGLTYMREDGSPEHFLDHTQVAQVCQAELRVAVINNKQWCAPVFGMCSTSCSGGCFSHLCCVGEWQCPALRFSNPNLGIRVRVHIQGVVGRWDRFQGIRRRMQASQKCEGATWLAATCVKRNQP